MHSFLYSAGHEQFGTTLKRHFEYIELVSGITFLKGHIQGWFLINNASGIALTFLSEEPLCKPVSRDIFW